MPSTQQLGSVGDGVKAMTILEAVRVQHALEDRNMPSFIPISIKDPMIAILQFDSVSLPHFHRLLNEGRLPALAKLRARGHWVPLRDSRVQWEGATYFTLYSGKDVKEHGIYFPFLWSAADQRVRPQDDYPIPEAVWERLARSGNAAL